ncbi:hypothetical protein ACHAXT_011264 [Thalassiosira profunda]
MAQVASADPPVECQWRSCHGNSYAVVKLCDIAALKSRLAKQAKEVEKQKLMEELGEEGYAQMLAEKKAQKEKEEAAAKLVPLLKEAMEASGHGVADTLEGIAISKTAAKTQWYVEQYQIDTLTPVDPTKKQAKYDVADVINLAHNRGINSRVKEHPDRQQLYARYLHDKFAAQCRAVDDATVVKAAYDKVRGQIEQVVRKKSAAVKCAEFELKVEETKLSAFDEMAEDMASGGGKKKAAAKGSKARAKENAENDAEKKPAAKKRKVAKKKGLAPADEPVTSSSAGRSSGRRKKAVSYAESESEYEEED